MTNICCFKKMKMKMMQVEREDGKIMEFTKPITVEELLRKFPEAIGVAVSKPNKNHNHQLSLTYKLKLGKMYYLLPKTSVQTELKTVEKDKDSAVTKRIKVVITKKQLQELLSKQISIEDVLMVKDAAQKQSSSNWRPDLQSIPEGDE